MPRLDNMTFSFREIKELEKSRKARDEQGLFVVEGKKLFLEAPRESLVLVASTKAFEEENRELFRDIPPGVQVIADVRPERFAGLSDTRTPQGILAVLRKPVYNIEETLQIPKEAAVNAGEMSRESENSVCFPEGFSADAGYAPAGRPPLFLFLEDIQDPGNAGTILRTAEAAGVDAVFYTKNTVDYYHPKTIRSTMGSIFRMPHFCVEDVPGFFEKLRAAGVRAFAAHLEGKRAYDEEDYRKGSIFLIGNEGNGLSEATAALADTLIRIPMAGRVESLNAAMAAGILMFEASRQRRTGK